MILLRSRLLRFFHFTKPSLSSIKSRGDLEAIMQKRLLRNIAEINAQKLQHYSFTASVQKDLQLSETAAREIEERTIQLSVIDPSTQHHQTVEARINQSLDKLALQGFNLSLPLIAPNKALHHFTQQRGVPNFQELQEYDFNERTLHIFNLPDNINQQDIQATLRATDAKISFKYCILGLPAYASVQFQTTEDLKACLQKLSTRKIAFGERTSVVRGPEDAEKLRLGYRRLVVALEEDSQLEEFAVQLSKFGRVLHIDWPLEASLNPTISEVKDFYRNSTELIRINQINKDGTIQSEYYPAVNAWEQGEDERGEENFIERAERLKESYEHRTRFARNVNVHIGKEHHLSLANRGYCVVTYSTYQECQSLYFTHGAETKMELVGEKLDFEFDSLFKKELLRQIDNEYLAGKKSALAQKKQHQKDYIDPVKEGIESLAFHYQDPKTYHFNYKVPDDFNLLQKIFNRICYTELSESNKVTSYFLSDYKTGNAFQKWQEHLDKYKNLKTKVNRKTFDELAEIELFGRVLPKDQNIERFVVEDPKVRKSRENELIEEHNLMTTHREVMARNKFYRRQQDRNNRIANEAEGYNIQEEVVEEVVEDVEVAANDGENIGKASFSTQRPAFLYRKRTAEEEAHFQHRYQQFVRSTIYEYMGVFHDKEIEEVSELKTSLVNPQSLRWRDGSSYFTEEEVEEALQFRRDFARAQQDYEDYIYGSEYVRSSGLNVNNINANRVKIRDAAVQHLTDVGLVESARKVIGQNLQQKANVLNAQLAQFGEEYRIEKTQNEQLLLKVRKLESLLPLDRVSHLQNFIAEHGEDVTPQQSAIFEKHYQQMRNNEPIPDEVSDAFGVERGLHLSDLLAKIGAQYKIFKKDLEMAERAKTYTPTELKKDINSQIKLQRSRRQHRKINSNDFAKDPSEIYAKDKEGYYKVSRYRQI